jgi:hypothetical protein
MRGLRDTERRTSRPSYSKERHKKVPKTVLYKHSSSSRLGSLLRAVSAWLLSEAGGEQAPR